MAVGVIVIGLVVAALSVTDGKTPSVDVPNPVTERQALAMQRSKELNPDLDGKLSFFIKNENGILLNLQDRAVKDITPIHDLAFVNQLNLRGSMVEDLSPIEEWLLLITLGVSETRVKSIEPLRGMNVKYLYLAHKSISDLESIHGMRATE